MRVTTQAMALAGRPKNRQLTDFIMHPVKQQIKVLSFAVSVGLN